MNSLPPECVHHILSFLPLRDLLRSHQVCRLWALLQPSVCVDRRQVTICIGRHSIEFIYKSRFRMPYEEVLDPSTPSDREPRLVYDAQNAKDNFDLLQFRWLDSVTCDKLVSLLPNVIELKVAVRQVPSAVAIGELSWGRKSVLMDQIIKMLTRWRSTLEAFTVSIYYFIDNKQRKTNQDHWSLFHAINQLDSLRQLTIEINDNHDVNIAPSIPDIEPFQFSVLSHLEQFSFFDDRQNLKLLLPSLIKHGGPESTLKRISLASINCDDIWRNDLSFDFTNQMGDWMRKVVHFPYLRISKFDRNVLSIFFKFPRLECITIEVDSLVKITQMLKYLESLRHLNYLKMNLYNSNSEYSMIDEMNDDELDEIDRPSVPIGDPCLPSVRVLIIYTSCLTHNDLCLFPWPRILPNLEILHYDNTSGYCKICSIERRSKSANMIDDQEPDPDRSPLARDESMLRRNNTTKLLSPWVFCRRIRRIYYDSRTQSKRWNLSELRQYFHLD